MMIIMKASDLPQPFFPSVHLKHQILNEIDEDANEQHKVLQIQFLTTNYKSQLCETSDDQQTNLDISNSKTVTIKVTVQQINPGGNNCIFICRNCENDNGNGNGNGNESENDTKLPKVFIAKEFRDNKDELGIYEHLTSLQGIYIPKCFGEIRWNDEDGVEHQGIALEFLEGFQRLEDADAKNKVIYEKCKMVMEAIGSKEVFHGDIAYRNFMWYAKNEEVRAVDFEHAKELTEMLIRDGKSVYKQNFIDLKGLFDSNDGDINHEYHKIMHIKPSWMLDASVWHKQVLKQSAETGSKMKS